ncbi:hypothetical protein Cni_G28130 [Canna indica]|uniref:Transmembrane protein n=1 Tax=Canna indica TaxID=4628 RepID=A0AAQ3L217_9LILI|nr:hypothetical protein Cni_G28130 [Canna indica]
MDGKRFMGFDSGRNVSNGWFNEGRLFFARFCLLFLSCGVGLASNFWGRDIKVKRLEKKCRVLRVQRTAKQQLAVRHVEASPPSDRTITWSRIYR